MERIKMLELLKYVFVALFFITTGINLWGNLTAIFPFAGMALLYILEIWSQKRRERLSFFAGKKECEDEINNKIGGICGELEEKFNVEDRETTNKKVKIKIRKSEENNNGKKRKTH